MEYGSGCRFSLSPHSRTGSETVSCPVSCPFVSSVGVSGCVYASKSVVRFVSVHVHGFGVSECLIHPPHSGSDLRPSHIRVRRRLSWLTEYRATLYWVCNSAFSSVRTGLAGQGGIQVNGYQSFPYLPFLNPISVVFYHHNCSSKLSNLGTVYCASFI